MPHTHHCAVCKIPVAVCSDDACANDETHGNAGEHYCPIHHTEAEHKVIPPPPLSRFNITVVAPPAKQE